MDLKYVYSTKLTSAGGGGSSTVSVTPMVRPPCCTFIVTHWKNFLNVALSMVSKVKTLSVSFFNGSVLAFGPAAHATMLVNK